MQLMKSLGAFACTLKKHIRKQHEDVLTRALATVGNGYQDAWLVTSSGVKRIMRTNNPASLLSLLPADVVKLEHVGLGATVTTKGGNVWKIEPITHKEFKRIQLSLSAKH